VAGYYEQALYHYYHGNYHTALARLNKVSTKKYPDKPIFKSSIYYQLKQFRNAQNILNKYQAPASKKHYKNYLRLAIALQLKQEKTAKSLLRKISSDYKSYFLKQKSELEFIKFHLNNKQLKKAQKAIANINIKSNDEVIKPDVLKYIIYLDVLQNNQESAINNYGTLIKLFPNADEDKTVWQQILRTFYMQMDVSDCFINYEDHFTYVKNLFKEKEYGRLEKNGEFLVKYLYDSRLSEIYQMLGIMYFNQYRFGKSIPAFKNVLLSLSTRDTLTKSNYFLARSFHKNGNINQALKYYQEIIKKFPTDYYQKYAQYYICKILSKANDYRNYKKQVHIFKNKYQHDQLWQQFMWENKISTIKLMAKKKQRKTAQKNLSALISNRKIYARLLRLYRQRFGRTKRGKRNNYYQLDGIKQCALSYYAYNILNSYYTSKNPLSVSKHYNYLYRIGLGKLGIDEIKYNLSTRNIADIRLIYNWAWLNAQTNNINESLNTIFQHLNKNDLEFGNLSKSFIKLLYPLPHWSTVNKYARKYRVDPLLVMAVMREESHFKIKSSSRAGAIGLMQIAPSTGKNICSRLGVFWKGHNMLNDAEINIKFGVFYLSWLQRVFNKKLHYMLSGYNAGPGITRRWIASFGTDDFEVFTSKISYPETKEYIERVYNSYLIYKLIYGK
jgi:soluble lytic murein transglycosylase-like protein